jgi:hypothetical protein
VDREQEWESKNHLASCASTREPNASGPKIGYFRGPFDPDFGEEFGGLIAIASLEYVRRYWNDKNP